MIDHIPVLNWFGCELTKKIEVQEVSIKRLAFAAKISVWSLTNYMNGCAFPNLWNLVLIADYLDCTVDELLGYESGVAGNMKEKRPAIEQFPKEGIFAAYLRDRIKWRMNERNVTVEELVELSGVRQITIDKYLCVHSLSPRVIQFLRICDALDCTPSDLLGY